MRQKKKRHPSIKFITQTQIKQELCFKLTSQNQNLVCSVYICQVDKTQRRTHIHICYSDTAKKRCKFSSSQIIGLLALVIRGDKPVSYLSKTEWCFKTLA